MSAALQALGHDISHNLVAELLHGLGYSLQANHKTREGAQQPDRDGQFRYINAKVRRFQRKDNHAVSVDTKKKELVGNFKNPGWEWRPKRTPEPVRVHDSLIPANGKAIPYGVYDLQRNEGWVSVGIDHDTASFAVNAIRSWWRRMGRPVYVGANELLITVCHFPPGTSKWNKIEHRLFSHIAMNWRGYPFVSLHRDVGEPSSASSHRPVARRARESDRRSTGGPIPGVSLSRRTRWHGSICSVIVFTVTGTIRLCPTT